MPEPVQGEPIAPVAPVAPAAPIQQPTQPVAPVAPAPFTPQQVPVAPVTPQQPVYQQQPVQGRTAEQFEKLLETNRLLNQELIRRNQSNQQFQPIQNVQPVAPQPVYEPNVADFTRIDPISGEEYIDKAKLQASLSRAEQEARKSQDMASRAEQAMNNYVQSANQREIERQNKETFNTYPELNPSAQNFDSRFHTQVRGILTDSFLNARDYGGRPLSFLEAAQYIKGAPVTVTPSTPQVTPGQTPAQPTAQQLKEQASAQVPSQPQSVLPSVNDAELQTLGLKTRLGDDKALAERLKFTEHIMPKEAQ